MKIVILDGYAFNPGDLSWEPLTSLGACTFYNSTAPEETIQRIGDAPLVFTNKVAITARVMDACPQLKFVGVFATGYNQIDVAAAKARGIVVSNVPAYSTPSVAQLTMALLLEACHHVGEHSRSIHGGAWCRSPYFAYWCYPLMELAGKTMGIIGYGSIGQSVSKIAQSFGLSVLYYSRTPKPELEHDQVHFAELEELFAKSDILSLHCPLFPETTNLIDEKAIAQMKDGVILLNTARGPLVDEEALAKALRTGKIAFAGLDVLRVEPMAPDCPLLGLENCLITPHIGWAPLEARQRLMDASAQNLRAFLEGHPINVVSN